jgi:hypothetical protein
MHEPDPERPPQSRPARHGTILLAGCALAIVGLALEPKAGPQVTGGGTSGGGTNPAGSLPTLPATATADSNRQMIAVTGTDLTGSSILYLIDTENRQLAIYQASGGSEATQGVRLVGARKIDLDLQLVGFNDKSQYTYEELEKRFHENTRPSSKPAK